MSEGPGTLPASSQIASRFGELMVRARTALTWEQAWPRAWLPVGIVLVFLTASWFGLWLDMGPVGRMIGLGLFAAVFAASFWPLIRFRRPTRSEVLGRIDRDTGLSHSPAHTLVDTLTIGSADPGTRALWALHRRRAEDAIRHMRVAPPRPDMPKRDFYALRAVALLAFVASAFVAGPEMGPRLSSAFDWRMPAGPGPAFRIDGWVDPPLYTRAPPVMIDLAKSQTLRMPVRSTVVIRIAGEGTAEITAGAGLAPLPPKAGQRADLREERFTLEANSEISLKTGFASGARLTFEAIPDRAPAIAFTGPPEVNGQGGFTLVYKGKDDYGIASTDGLVERSGNVTGRSLVPAPALSLAIPNHDENAPETRALVDLSTHPWAGAKVKIQLRVKDEAGQEGLSETIDFTLPQRAFSNPLAKALVEQRRDLVLAPDDRRWVQTALDALLIEPDSFTPQWGVFMGLRLAAERLRQARSDEALLEVAEWLWTMAVQIEDGNLSDSEQQLRAAQERLKEAMDRGAPDSEIKRLTDELRQAMDRFLREFAQRMQDNPTTQDPNQREPDRVISQNDLNRMLEKMEDAMRRGDVAEAQRLLDELRNILENLQTARPDGRMSDPLGREMQQSMRDLEDMARDQQNLRDDTFRDGQNRRMQQGDRNRQHRQRGQRGEPGDNQEQAENGEEGEGQQEGQSGKGLSERQQALRERLRELQRRMQGQGMQNEQGLGDAEEAMREAEGALGQGQDGEAVDAQGRALEGLRRGMQGMAQQMQQMQEGQQGNEQAGDQPGGQANPQGREQAGRENNDPLGRPTRSRDAAEGGRPIPSVNESPAQRAGRILEELRRKLGDPTRPQEELDYFDRLLRRN
ncbi:TIGR02302 family protein [Microvirga brassicacearum]|uniref:TIGR02302 family protein n=1 Tax=Microvirga brassicacearum TaxID=2580413 RepID=A0A5N3PHH1_9HYPH|nr:TIGR02302 family protein [Microvirga brassicacearum]KAB0269179.1 TIGR02302 family protein [Microvirga brassicacearum]